GTDIKLGEGAKELGGLKVIGTERHESRRIDNQLRGRSGRQGDPGVSKFYVSLEDDLMRLFGSDRYKSMFQSLGLEYGQEIQHPMVTKAIERAQKKIEERNFETRKRLLEYDQVMNEQREIIYAERRRVLEGESMRDVIYKMITDIVEKCVDQVINDDQNKSDWALPELNQLLLSIIPLQPITVERIRGHKKNELKQQLKEEAVKSYEAKEAEFPQPELIRELERIILLKSIDSKWMVHIDDMVQLRDGIGLVAYAQKDPVQEYKNAAYDMFEDMTENIRETTVQVLMRIRVGNSVEREPAAKVTGTNRDDSLQKGPVRKAENKIYPNDPCPCGSGLKYKNCCGRKGAITK
ncbi:MAG: SEC-C domain-containing protein, partial [Lachnospiraceae bacterium]|nr:SEC-C domain-containing protein [Lachnospiraceae bacterium]